MAMVEPVGKKAKMMYPDGVEGDGLEVQVVESTERWSEFTLEDGTKLRLKLVIAAFIRADNAFDGDGNPIYAVKGGPQINFISVPEKYRHRPI